MRQIFVFGSNLAGRHGKGAALAARKQHGAVSGKGDGLHGNSYAIPTKDWNLVVLPLPIIKEYVDLFLAFASENKDLAFNVTRVGCGLAGYSDDQMGPMFSTAPSNCMLPDEWIEFRGY